MREPPTSYTISYETGEVLYFLVDENWVRIVGYHNDDEDHRRDLGRFTITSARRVMREFLNAGWSLHGVNNDTQQQAAEATPQREQSV